MSLDWDIAKVKDREQLYPPQPNGSMNYITYELIWATMLVDIGEITELNCKKFYNRLMITDALLKDQSRWGEISFKDVKNHIGLHTNVTTITDHKWLTTRVKGWINR